MNEQIKFPFKRKEEEEKLIGRMFGGRMSTPEEDEELTESEGGKPTSPEKIKKAREEALDEILGRQKENKEQREN